MGEVKKGIPAGILSMAMIIGPYLVMRYGVSPPFPSALIQFYMIFIAAGVLIYLTLDDRRIGEFLDFISLRSRERAPWDLSRKALLALIPLLLAYHVYSEEKVRYSPPAELFSPHVTPRSGPWT